MPPLLLVTWRVCLRSSLSSTLPLDQGESGQGRKQPKPGDALKGRHPSPIQFLCLPSTIEITPDSMHQMLSPYYNVHPRLSTHHRRLYLYLSFTLICHSSLVKIKLHRVRSLHPACHTPLDPTSNSDRLLHP